MFATFGATSPSQISTEQLFAWCSYAAEQSVTHSPHIAVANNTIRQRISRCRTFFRWCVRQRLVEVDPAADLSGEDSPLRSIRRTYGKAQSKNPPRFLTYEEAFVRLPAACQDGSHVGVRDEIIIRLGLLGLRASEIGTLRIDDLHLTGDRLIRWTGKGRKPRTARPGPKLNALVDDYLDRYDAACPSTTAVDERPLFCPQIPGSGSWGGPGRINWGRPFGNPKGHVYVVVQQRARLAGLGHVAPHDLRRTAAAVLHRTRTADGGHRFDLLDIQRVLGHSDPATTMRSYLEPMDTTLIDNAGDVLD